VNERERERNTHTLPRAKLLKVPDISAEERIYSRSIKIRLAILEYLKKLSERDHDSLIAWDSITNLAVSAANYVEASGWDTKPASSVTAARWCQQFMYGDGPFQSLSLGSGLFRVAYRNELGERRVLRMLKEFRRRRANFKKEQQT
jgi:hypothetical protein